mgnify:FL=1
MFKYFIIICFIVEVFLFGYCIGNIKSRPKYYVHPLGAKLWYYRGANAYQKAMHQSENTDELRSNIQAIFERDSLANF